MYYFFYKKFAVSRGFTLIELIVVISIIGILTSVVAGSISGALAVGRDHDRQIDLKSFKLDITLYKDFFGAYPAAGCPVTADEWVGPGVSTDSGFTECNKPDEWIVDLVPNFMSELPADERGKNEDNKGYYYRTNDAKNEYKLIIKGSVEEITIASNTDDFARYGNSCEETLSLLSLPKLSPPNDYAIYYDTEPGDGSGAECW